MRQSGYLRPRALEDLDLEHDREDRAAARRIVCPLLAIWAKGGLVERFGDLLAIWRVWADRVDGGPVVSQTLSALYAARW